MTSDGFKIGDITLRTLEQQVLKNKEDIANHYNRDRVLADFGIRVIGQVETASNLPAIETPPQFEYGDAYVVGTSEPYSIYVFTRADINSGHPDPYFLDIGPIAAEGPVGPIGPEGPQGPRGFSPKWFAGDAANIQDSNYPTREESEAGIENFYFDTKTGNVIKLYKTLIGANRKLTVANIKGPQGIKGEKGDIGPQGPRGPQGLTGPQGPVANVVEILGIVYNIDSLPDPTTVPSNSAYLYKHSDLTDIYIIIDDQWTNAGNFGGGSSVEANGLFVQNFNADTKVNTQPLVSGQNARVYASRGTGTNNNPNAYYNVTAFPRSDSLPVYSVNTSNQEIYAAFSKNHCLYTGEPKFDYHCVPKKYVDALHQSIPQHYIDFVIKRSGIIGQEIIDIDLRGTPLQDYVWGAFRNPTSNHRFNCPITFIEMNDSVPLITLGQIWMFGNDNKIVIDKIQNYGSVSSAYHLYETYKEITIDEVYTVDTGHYEIAYTPGDNTSMVYDIYVQIPLIKMSTY